MLVGAQLAGRWAIAKVREADRRIQLAAEENLRQIAGLHARLDRLEAGIEHVNIECDQTDRIFASIMSECDDTDRVFKPPMPGLDDADRMFESIMSEHGGNLADHPDALAFMLQSRRLTNRTR